MAAPHPDHAHWRAGSATDRLFIIVVAIKGLDGALGIIGGILLFFVKPHTIDVIVASPTCSSTGPSISTSASSPLPAAI
jgi:uncharacterized membrane protein